MPSMPRTRRAVALMVLVAFVGGEAGCSWIIVKKEPSLPLEPTQRVECTTSRSAPAIDLTGTLLAAATSVGALGYGALGWAAGEGTQVDWTTIAVVAAAGAVGAAVLGFSMAYGFKHAKECERLKSLQAACVSGDQDSCTLLRGEQPGPSEAPGSSPAESWLRDAAGLTSTRLWQPQEPDP